MKYYLWVLALTAGVLNAAELRPVETALVVSQSASTEHFSLAAVCHQVMVKEMGEPSWKQFVGGVQKRYEQWCMDNDNGSIKRFLDDKLLTLASGALSGKGTKLKEFCTWVALYDVFYEPVPHYLRNFGPEDLELLRKEMKDMNWDRVAVLVKAKAGERE